MGFTLFLEHSFGKHFALRANDLAVKRCGFFIPLCGWFAANYDHFETNMVIQRLVIFDTEAPAITGLECIWELAFTILLAFDIQAFAS